jgi:CBS domain-containing protein
MLCARDIMTTDLLTVGPNATVQEAIETLLHHRISGLPVVDANRKLIGMITEFGLLAVAYDLTIRQEKILKHMTTEIISVSPDDSIRAIADVCIMHRVRRVPVVENGRIIGVVARRDVLKGIFEAVTQSCVLEACIN